MGRQRFAPFAAGAAVPLIATLLAYGAWGALGDLLYNMFVFPATVPGYATPIELPTLAAAAGWVAATSGVVAACRALGPHPGRALPWLVGGVVLAAFSAFGSPSTPITDLPAEMDGLLHAALIGLSLVALAPTLLAGSRPSSPSHAAGPQRSSGSPDSSARRSSGSSDAPAAHDSAEAADPARSVERADEPRGADPAEGLEVSLAIVFFSCSLVVQIYPRAGYNVWLLAAALGPLVILLMERVAGAVMGSSRARRSMAVAVLAALLGWWAMPAVSPVFRLASAPKRALSLPGSEGLVMTERQYRGRRMADVEALVSYLRAEHPPDAPVFVLSNQAMIFFATGHPTLFPDREYYLSLVGWQMLPQRDLVGLDEPDMIATLADRRDALVIQRAVDREDRTPVHYRASFPELFEFIEQGYREVARFGVYRVLAPAH